MFSVALVGTLIGLCLAQDLADVPPMPESRCSRDSFGECLTVFYTDMEMAATHGVAAGMNPAVAICRNYADIDMCMREKVKDCAPGANQMLTALRNGLNYLCHEKSDETHKFVTCMISDPARATKMESCFLKLWKEQADVMQGAFDSKRVTSEMCGYARQWETCLERKASEECNAGTLITGFFDIINKGLPSEICGDQLLNRPDVRPNMPTEAPEIMPEPWRPPFDVSRFVPSRQELACNQPMKMERCMAPIFASHMGPPKTVDEMCSMAQQAERCVDSVTNTCNEESKRIWAMLHKVVSYACVEKRTEWQDSFPCLNGMAMDLPNIVMKCMKPLGNPREGSHEDSDEIDDYRRQERSLKDFDFNKHQMCWFLDQYEDCMEDAVQSRCGVEARDLMEGMFSLVNEYTEEKFEFHCQEFERPEGGHIEIVVDDFGEMHHQRRHKMLIYGLSAGVPALVILIVLVIVLVVVCRRRSTRQTKTDKCVLVKHDLLHENMKQVMADTSAEKQKV